MREAAKMSTVSRARRVLALAPFRKLWLVTGICSSADWLTMLALSGLASGIAPNSTGQTFAFSGVLFANLLPGLLFAPVGGLLADRFNRKIVMAIADVIRCGLLLSILVANSYWWVFAGTFLVQVAAIMWIPCKDAALPNLLRRPDQVEPATQLGLVMTYGLSVLCGGGLFVLITGASTTLHLPPDLLGSNGYSKAAVVVAASFYVASAVLIMVRLPELSLRVSPGGSSALAADSQVCPVGTTGLPTMLRDSWRYIRSTPVVRGLLIGMLGAFAAGGAIVGSAYPYAVSLLGGQASFGLLLIAIFVGAVSGLVGAPKFARKIPHGRLFGMAIVVAGLTLIPVAMSPHLAISLLAFVLVGAGAATGFLTGITIIGTEVADSVRGRINALYQAMLKVVLGCSIVVTPLLIIRIPPLSVHLWGTTATIDRTRPVILGAGLVAVVTGLVAYRQMNARGSATLMSDLRGFWDRRRPTGFLIAVEGSSATDTAVQSQGLVDRLRNEHLDVVLAPDLSPEDATLERVVALASLSTTRSRALAAAAIRADIVERIVQPALAAGAIVVMECFADSPLAHFAASSGLDPQEADALSSWATSSLRPDLVVLLDGTSTQKGGGRSSENHQQQVQKLLIEVATTNSERYVLVDAEGDPDEVGERVRLAVRSALPRSFTAAMATGRVTGG